jgi:hypothetical protein
LSFRTIHPASLLRNRLFESEQELAKAREGSKQTFRASTGAMNDLRMQTHSKSYCTVPSYPKEKNGERGSFCHSLGRRWER